MAVINNDLSIFTSKNENGIKLSDRLNTVLTNSKYFDVLVGYFRITGFYLLKNQLEDVEEIRILIGLGADIETVKAMDIFELSGANATRKVQKIVTEEFNNTEDDNLEMENGVFKFCEWIKSGKLKIRMCYEKNVHAKLYIVRKDLTKVPDQFGNLITGSSNFTFNGLDKNVEFNVELKDQADVQYGLDFFEDLWKDSRDVTANILTTISNDTWMNKSITPWLGVTSEWGDGDKSYLMNSTKCFKGNYFNDFLEPLFYNALNAKRDNDAYLGKKIPFLNGGLFRPIENYDWKNTECY